MFLGQVEPQVKDTVFSRSEAIAQKHFGPNSGNPVVAPASAVPGWTYWAPGAVPLVLAGTGLFLWAMWGRW